MKGTVWGGDVLLEGAEWKKGASEALTHEMCGAFDIIADDFEYTRGSGCLLSWDFS